MAIKFQRDGATFPTSAREGVLTIYMGDANLTVEIPFLTGVYEYDNSYFPMSNIMCYLFNDTETVILRFDGTATRYNKDGDVIGFVKFDVNTVYKGLTKLPVGVEWIGGRDNRQAYRCCVYIVNGTECTVFESTRHEEAICFKVKENSLFVDELMRGTRYFPALICDGDNHYVEDTGRYELIGYPIHVTGMVNI